MFDYPDFYHTKSKVTIPISPLFQKTAKVSQKELHSNPHIQKPTSPAITVTSWEETNKGQDEFTHGSHIITARRNSTSTDHSSHISGDNPSKSFRSIMGNKSLPEEDQDLVDPEMPNLDADSLSKSENVGKNKRSCNKYPDSLNNSVSPT